VIDRGRCMTTPPFESCQLPEVLSVPLSNELNRERIGHSKRSAGSRINLRIPVSLQITQPDSPGLPPDMINIPDAPLIPNKADIAAHLYALFDPAFVLPYPDAWIEIAFGRPDGKLNKAGNFPAFDLQEAVDFAVEKNAAGFNVYVGAALRHGGGSDSGRANGDNVLDASHAWAEYDGPGDDERIQAVLKANNLTPAMVVTTGTTPYLRRHLNFQLDGAVTPERLEAANTALCRLLGSDAVQGAPRVLRLGGTINYPSPDKVGRGYVAELTTLHENEDARAFKLDELIGLAPSGDASNPFIVHGEEHGGLPVGRNDAELMALLQSINGKDGGKEKWRNPLIRAVGSMVGHGWPDTAIKLACAPYCDDGIDDADLKKIIEDQQGFREAECGIAGHGRAKAGRTTRNQNQGWPTVCAGDQSRADADRGWRADLSTRWDVDEADH
jgi:hypothetical protein